MTNHSSDKLIGLTQTSQRNDKMENKAILKQCVQKGFLLDKEILNSFGVFTDEEITDLVSKMSNLNLGERVITKTVLKNNIMKIQTLFFSLKNRSASTEFFAMLGISLDISRPQAQDDSVEIEGEKKSGIVKLISAPTIIPKKIVVQDFVNHFRFRYEQIQNIFTTVRLRIY